VFYHRAIIGALVIATLAACGGGNKDNNAANAVSSAAAAAPSAMASAENAAGSAMATAGNAMMNNAKAMAGSPAPIPSDLNCGAVQPVWINTRTHKYHEPADPMYGKTKAGKYMCPADAKAEGDTPAGHRKGHTSSGM